MTADKQVIEQIRNMQPLQKMALLDILKVKAEPRYIRRPAKDIKEFVRSEYYLNVGEECWDTILDILIEFERSDKNIAVFEMPPGAGKSYLSSIATSYEIHKILCLREPQRELGLARGSNIAVMNMSQSATQAKKVVFGEIKARIDYSFWFRQFARPDPDKTNELDFGNNVFIIPGNSSETNPFGYNLVVVVMDEVAWWDLTSEHDYVKEAFESLEKRLGNRYGKRWRWKIILITNASYPERYVEYLIEQPKVFGVRKAIWDVKPWLFKSELVKWEYKGREYLIPKELDSETRDNPDSLLRDMLSQPSETITPWMANQNAIREVMSKGEQISEDIPELATRLRGKNCYAHIDLALSGCAAGVAITYKEDGVIHLPCIKRITGTKANPIKFSDIRQFVIGLRDKGVNIRKLSYDGFQSADSIQIMKDNGIEAELLSVDRGKACYDTLKGVIYDKRITIPETDILIAKASPVSALQWLIRELCELEDRKGKIDHRPKGSKDVADATCGATYHAVKEPEAIRISGSKTPSFGGESTLERDEFRAEDVGKIY